MRPVDQLLETQLFKIYLNNQNKQLEVWEKDVNREMWSLGKTFDLDKARSYATLLTEVLKDIK